MSITVQEIKIASFDRTPPLHYQFLKIHLFPNGHYCIYAFKYYKKLQCLKKQICYLHTVLDPGEDIAQYNMELKVDNRTFTAQMGDKRSTEYLTFAEEFTDEVGVFLF